MRSSGVLRWGAALVVLSVGALQPGALTAADQAGCRRAVLDPRPRWSFSAAWSADGSELTVVDVLGARLLRYAADGKHLGTVARRGDGELEFDHPTELTAAGDGYLLKNPPGKLIWLDRDLRPLRALDFLAVRSAGGQEIISVGLKGAMPVGGDLVGFAMLRRDGRHWKGFVRVATDPLVLTELIEEVRVGSPADRMFGLAGGERVAVAAGRAYALRYADPTFLLQLTPARRPLTAFPADFRKVPERPPGVGGPTSGPLLAKVLERATFAADVYGRGRFLYLLTRRPSPGGTLWQLWQIDPQRDAVLRSLDLPTTANDLFLVPGPQQWAAIEKGPMTAPGVQEIRSMLLLPTAWIEDPASKVLTDGHAPACR